MHAQTNNSTQLVSCSLVVVVVKKVQISIVKRGRTLRRCPA